MQKLHSENKNIRSWKKFIFFQVPISIFVLLITIEIFALSLKNTRPLRHPLDNLVHKLENSKPINSNVVLFGDSVTQDIATVYDLSHEGKVTNLTTNMANGIIGVLLLYERYIKKNQQPNVVIIASSPEFIGFSPEKEARRLYLSSVFNNDKERILLKTLFNEKKSFLKENNSLSISRFNEKIVLPLLGLLIRNKNGDILFGNQKVSKKIDKDIFIDTDTKIINFSTRTNAPPIMAKSSAKALTKLCRILEENKTKLLIAWAPMPQSTWNDWKKANILNEWQKLILDLDGKACKKANFYDFSDNLNYSDKSFRDINHLKRNGWANVYAIQLNNFIGSNLKNE